MRKGFVIFVSQVQAILFLTHLLLYVTWAAFWPFSDSQALFALRLGIALLSVSFVTASLLAFRYRNILVRIYYTLAAIWLGALTYCVLACAACWLAYLIIWTAGLRIDTATIADITFGAAGLVAIYGVMNASWIRVKRVTVRLPNLPEAWRGRMAALVSDTHLGPIRNERFASKVVSLLLRTKPDVVFLAGDLYDGTAADIQRLAQPWSLLSAPLGSYYVTGNHEEFSTRGEYCDAIRGAGIRVLDNEKIVVDGVQIIGVHYRESANPRAFQSILERAALRSDAPSILLTHTPSRLGTAAEAGISLQLSGHTHHGQFFPYTWITERIYGKYVYGLERFRDTQIYVSCGAGTWGPPLRVGTNPEIALIRFE